MKKLGMFLVFALAMIFAMPNVYAQKLTDRQIKKEVRKKAKQLKKEGWTIYGSPYTLETALTAYYQDLQKEGAQNMVGVASSFMSKNVGKQAALNSAINEYARQAQSFVEGRVVSDMFNNASDAVPEEFDKFYAAYQSMVVKEIKGELKASFSLIRSKGMQDDKEVFEMQTYFVLNELEASKARMRAMENAMKESTLSQEYASKVAGFIREGFDLESGE